MGNQLKITKIDIHEFQWETPDLAQDDYYNGFNLVYKAGATLTRTERVLQIHTDQGITGEFAGGSSSDYAQMRSFFDYLIERNPLQRELIYNDVKRCWRS